MKHSKNYLSTGSHTGLCKTRKVTSRLFAILAFVLLMMMSTPAKSNAQTYGAVFDSISSTLTLKDCSSAGTPSVDYFVIKNGIGISSAFQYAGLSVNDLKKIVNIVIDKSFYGYKPTDLSYFFGGLPSLVKIEGLENLYTSEAKNMSFMFGGCSKLTKIDLSNFNTANATNMSNMFRLCASLGKIDLSSFNTAKVTDMSGMFHLCSVLDTITFGDNFNTATVTDMSNMFRLCASLGKIDLSSFNTAKVTDMSNMFNGCSILDTIAFGDNFNTAQVTNMSNMFRSCQAMSKLELSFLNTANATSMFSMFRDCSALTDLDLSSFNTANVTDMNSMFLGCAALTHLDLSSFNTANVTTMYGMFQGCAALTHLDLSSFNTTCVTSMSNMFQYCTVLTDLDLSSFNTANVTTMSRMFQYDSKLKNIYVGELFSTDGLIGSIKSSSMFWACDSLPNFDPKSDDKTHANYGADGYLQTYYKVGNKLTPLSGDSLCVNELVLVDDEDFVARAPFTAEKVSYSRSITDEAKWNSLCLPFEVQLTDQNFRAFKLLSISGDVVKLEELENTIPAGTPAIISINEGETAISISAQNQPIMTKALADTTTTDELLRLVGFYSKLTLSKDTDNNCYLVNDDKLMNPAKILENDSESSVTSKPFRAYMAYDDEQALQAAQMFYIGKGPSTAVEELNADNNCKAEYYDLQGRSLSNLQKGINIVKRGNKATKVFVK